MWVLHRKNEMRRDKGARVEMIKNDGEIAGEHMPWALRPEPVSVVIPGSHSPTMMLQLSHALKSGRPIVQIHLVAHLAGLSTGVAPFQTALPPPAQRFHPANVSPERKQPDIVRPVRITEMCLSR